MPRLRVNNLLAGGESAVDRSPATPPIAGTADAEYGTRLDAERVTLEFASKRQPIAPQESLDDLPLLGGNRQQELF